MVWVVLGGLVVVDLQDLDGLGCVGRVSSCRFAGFGDVGGVIFGGFWR